MKKAKRIICIIMAALTIISAPVMSYMEAQAGELVLELSLLDQLLIMFGINAGLGEQYDYFKRQDELKGLFEAAAEGGTAELSGYGTVNFSETQSLKEWFEWSLDCQKFLLGNLSVVNPENAARYMEAGKALDEVSYNNSGTCATNALDDNISAFYDDYSNSSETLVEDIRSCFTVINGGGGFNDDNDDDEEKAARRQKFWKTFFAVTAAGMLGVGNAAVPLSAMKMYSDSEFNEYDFSTAADGFSGSLPKYSITTDPSFEGYKSSYVLCTVDSPYGASIDDEYYLVSDSNYCGVYDGNYIRFFSYYSGKLNSVYVSGRSIHNNGANVTTSKTTYIDKSKVNSFYGPLFSSVEDALNYFKTGDKSGILNMSDDNYRNFKQNTGTAGAVIGNPFSGYISSLKSLADVSDIISLVREASDAYGGTSELLPELARILSEAGDIAVDKPDADDPNGSAGYSGILAKILAAINSLPSKILTALTGKFMTAEGLTRLINNLPALFVEAFTGMLELTLQPIIAAINLVPASMQARLIEIFPNAIAIGNAIIDFPEAVARAIEGIAINVPEIKIPEITIPEITIPEITIPEIEAPDVNVELNPKIMLDPSYNINVENDYTGLDDIISKSVGGVMTDMFIPNAPDTLEKVGEMQEYFEFKDDVIRAVDDLKTMIFGITPSPILKIPIGKTTSKKYNYGTGNYIIIDVSWYAPYKQFGDKVILAIAWALFLWHLFLKLPGIISGTEGSIMAADRSYQKYLSGKE